MKTFICKAIDCPYHSGDYKKSYGCQMYSSAVSCHLVTTLGLINGDMSTDYELITSKPIDLDSLKRQNDAYIKGTERYGSDRNFQVEFPDLVARFPSRVL
jgi:hypothetical protein